MRRAADERYAVIYIREEVEDLVLLSLVALDLLDRLANLTKVRGKTLRARFRYALTVLPELVDDCTWQDQRGVSFTDELDQHVEQRRLPLIRG